MFGVDFDKSSVFEKTLTPIMKTDFKKHVEIYTDGACSGNPGPGGWGVIIRYHDKYRELSGYEAATTNNRMELFAALSGLRALPKSCNVILYSDSTYLINAFNQKWLIKWQSNNWKKKDGNDVLNKDLWEDLLYETKRNNVKFVKVKGHSDDENNDRCDKLAKFEIAKNLKT